MSCECSFFILQVNAYDGDLALAVDPHMDEEFDRAMICPLCGVQLLSFVEVLQHNCFDACFCLFIVRILLMIRYMFACYIYIYFFVFKKKHVIHLLFPLGCFLFLYMNCLSFAE